MLNPSFDLFNRKSQTVWTNSYAVLAIALIVVSLGTMSVHADDFHTDMMRATVKLRHDSSTASGFVLRQSRPQDQGGTRSVLITAAHVLEKTKGAETTLVYRVREGEGIYKKQTIPLAIRKDDKPLWTKHSTEDVAVMPVVIPDGADLSELSVDALANDDLLRQHKIHPGQTIACLGYPHKVEANEAGFPILRIGAIASYPLIPSTTNKTFLFSANTFEGDSGGPIYHAETGLILGLMHGQHFLDEEMVLIYGTSKLRHRLGLGIVVQSASIRQTLEQLP